MNATRNTGNAVFSSWHSKKGVVRPVAATMNPSDGSHLNGAPPTNFALRVALVYTAISIVWIVGSDTVVDAFFSAASEHFVQTLKGFLFVLVTALGLFLVLRASGQRELSLVQRLRDAIYASRDGLWHWDISRDRIVATAGGDLELGWNAARTIRGMEGWKAAVHPEDWAGVQGLLDELNTADTDAWVLQQRFRTAKGDWHWIEIKGHVLSRSSDGTVEVMEGTYHSIDGLKRTQLSIERTNRALRILVAAYNAVASGRSSSGALALLVERIADAEDCPVAWVGEVRNDPDKHIVPFACAGPASAFVKTAEFRWDDSPYGRGPSGTCIRKGEPSLVGDVLNSEGAAAWREELNHFGIRSGVSIPIEMADGQRFVLHVAGNSPQQFSDDDTDTYEMIAQVLRLMIDSADVAVRFSQSEIARLEIAERLQKATSGVISALATVVEKRDPYTAGHQHRVAELAVAIGRELALSEDRLEGLRIGAWIHDVGKIGVPTEILSKPGRLDGAEIALIQRHAQIGYDIVKSIDFGWPIEKIVYQHHERIDGSGYPQGLKGEQIALEARIVAVADVIESMGTDRPYRAKIPWQAVIDEIESGRGTKYDENVVAAAFSVLDTRAEAFGFNTAR